MTNIGFYILTDKMNRMQFLAKLTEQLYRSGSKCHIHTGNPLLAKQVSQALWTARDVSFIPHEQLPCKNQAPVTIGIDEEPEDHSILINMSNDIPPCFSHFERVVEIIDSDPELKNHGRAHYKFYKDRGYPVENHKIG